MLTQNLSEGMLFTLASENHQRLYAFDKTFCKGGDPDYVEAWLVASWWLAGDSPALKNCPGHWRFNVECGYVRLKPLDEARLLSESVDAPIQAEKTNPLAGLVIANTSDDQTLLLRISGERKIYFEVHPPAEVGTVATAFIEEGPTSRNKIEDRLVHIALSCKPEKETQ